MSVVCPAAVARAPVSVVWTLLTEPSRFEAWTDARPVKEWDRPLRPGDVVEMRAKPIPLKVWWEVVDSDQTAGRLRLSIRVPFGIHNDETISLVDQGGDDTLIRFY